MTFVIPYDAETEITRMAQRIHRDLEYQESLPPGKKLSLRAITGLESALVAYLQAIASIRIGKEVESRGYSDGIYWTDIRRELFTNV
jgi:hypothetical protein